MFVVLLLLMMVFTAACERRPQAPASEAGIVIAKIDGQEITDRDFLGLVDLVQERTPLKLSTHPQKKDLLEQAINLQLLYEEGIRKGLQNKFQFRAKIADVYLDQMIKEVRDSIADEQIRAEYLRDPKKYDKVSARHIFFSLPEGRGSDENFREGQRRKALSILEELKSKPDSFPAIARQHSQDRSARQGGELGFFTREQMEKSVSDAAFALKNVGDLSPVIRSNYGYHVVQLTGDRRGFDHHKEEIRASLTRSMQKEKIKREIERLRAQKKIQIFEDNLSKLSPLPEVVTQDPMKTIEQK